MTDPDAPGRTAGKGIPGLSLSGWIALASLGVAVVCLFAVQEAREQIEDAKRRIERTVELFEKEKETVSAVVRDMQTLVGRFEQLERDTAFELKRGNSRIEGMEEELTLVRDAFVEMERARSPAVEVPAATPRSPAVPRGELRFYKVVDGDNLYRISRKLSVTVKELLDANPTIDPNRLRIGQDLVIPPNAVLP